MSMITGGENISPNCLTTWISLHFTSLHLLMAVNLYEDAVPWLVLVHSHRFDWVEHRGSGLAARSLLRAPRQLVHNPCISTSLELTKECPSPRARKEGPF